MCGFSDTNSFMQYKHPLSRYSSLFRSNRLEYILVNLIVNGQWTTWSQQSPCSATCGTGFVRSRNVIRLVFSIFSLDCSYTYLCTNDIDIRWCHMSWLLNTHWNMQRCTTLSRYANIQDKDYLRKVFVVSSGWTMGQLETMVCLYGYLRQKFNEIYDTSLRQSSTFIRYSKIGKKISLTVWPFF